MNLRPGLVAVSLILSSCSRAQPGASGSPSATAAAASAPSAAALPMASAPMASASAAPIDPATAPTCAFVTKSEAEEIFGEPIAMTVLPMNGLCQYFRASDQTKRMKMPLVTVELDLSGAKATFESQTQNAANIMHAPRTPRPGFGEEAFLIGKGELAILQHGRSIAITQLQPVDAAKFDAFAHKAVTRL
jgi:hypothetical protein